ncbi:unnamed protein product [Sphenostylis stenocarpa]|uniref:Uncharacterized protein n=1 Tax=Sphenostylis stenocarpa TaxID=92480 RepID=A0AA86SWC8_9FABA|nr:unnamed protein product [Sphenostylis stenocarpa]
MVCGVWVQKLAENAGDYNLSLLFLMSNSINKFCFLSFPDCESQGGRFVCPHCPIVKPGFLDHQRQRVLSFTYLVSVVSSQITSSGIYNFYIEREVLHNAHHQISSGPTSIYTHIYSTLLFII